MSPVRVVRDERFAAHLAGIPHLESPRRVRILDSMLQHPSLSGKWSALASAHG